MDERDLRREAVRRHLVGDGTKVIAADLGRTERWVHKWVARFVEDPEAVDWAESRSRRPQVSPTATPEEVRELVLDARSRLQANPRAQRGAVAIAWELRRLGVDPIPEVWTIKRILARAGVTRPRRRQAGYQSKGVPYPIGGGDSGRQAPPGGSGRASPPRWSGPFLGAQPGGRGQPPGRHRDQPGDPPAPSGRVAGRHLAWVGIPAVCQLDNHTTMRGGIPPMASHFGPVVATCLDLGVVPRFIPIGEPWRNGVVEHFNDVWDKSFFRTARFDGIDHLRAETADFDAIHRALKARAASEGHTLSEQALSELTRSLERPSRTALLERLAGRRQFDIPEGAAAVVRAERDSS